MENNQEKENLERPEERTSESESKIESKETEEPLTAHNDVKEEPKQVEPSKSINQPKKEIEQVTARPKPNFIDTYEEGIFQRKKESFINFQNWENKRREIVQNNKTLINNMVTRVEKKLDWLDAGVENIIKFFKERITQEETFAKIMNQNLPQLGKLFTHQTHPEIFGNFAKAMNDCDDYHKKSAQNNLAISKFLSTTILDHTLITFEKYYKKNLEKLREPIIDHRKRLQNIAQEVATKHQKLMKLFEETQKRVKSNSKDKDFCKKEVDCFIACQEEMKLTRQFGQEAIKFILEIRKLLETRLSNIQKAMTLYFQKMNDIYGKSAMNSDTILNSLNNLKITVDLEEYFSVQKTLSLDEISYLQALLKSKSDLTYQEIQTALVEKSNLPAVEKKPLVMKQWTAGKDCGILRSWKPCSVIVTADANILIVERSAEGHPEKTDSVLKLQLIKIQKQDERKDRSIIEITETSPGFLLNTTKKVVLKFDNEDMAEEFLHYVFNFYNSIIVSEQKK